MTVSSFIDLKKKYETGAFRWHVIELYRLGLVSEGQIVSELTISRTSLRLWNRSYQRYRLRRYHPHATFCRLAMTQTDEIALLKQQLAQTEALFQLEKLKREAAEMMITIAGKDRAACAV